MTRAFKSRVVQALETRRDQGLNRQTSVIFSGNQTVLEHQGKRYLNFSGNDYLGLANDQSLIHAWQQGLSLYGCGSGASPLVTGYTPAHSNLAASLCDWLGYESAVLFGSGFSANQAVLFSLLEKSDLLLQDKLNHASLMEAGMLSPATMKRFKHNDLSSLEGLLKQASSPKLIVTEGVFSMDGDRSPIAQIALLAAQHNAALMVDDAHGIGVLGEEGRGSCEEVGIKPDILVVTFGKAFGLSGAAVLTDQATGDYFTQLARHHVYSTSIPPAQAFALTHAIEMIRQQSWRREKLHELQQQFDALLGEHSSFVATATPIKPWILGDSQTALNVATRCREQGIWLTAIRPPTVPQNSARLRITLSANHKKEHVQTLAKSLLMNSGEM
ncbi:TPA: 8-amino-7-oxononanoate synthase [Vibrio vulnificus]|uniref:8-amino-7-oxononanoate synthase n=1 Tax=Vibrio sp. 05-20-BW147 TaxID=2575834 RepID=UPI0015948625|nr:8-amino-7-oxononanoate synthase [Vibrio sp. 05-20-BW147]NVC62514.1 8-amino-7-oxononanoate synthase [Vibrio sp. 05-20-BW147]HAV6899067.1 8-amino-7-oxononanoate synthase [Vibrio vulnificus]HDY7434907.1 8-amino-7-oxononanoate synthase [Vibrio vulnificus]